MTDQFRKVQTNCSEVSRCVYFQYISLSVHLVASYGIVILLLVLLSRTWNQGMAGVLEPWESGDLLSLDSSCFLADSCLNSWVFPKCIAAWHTDPECLLLAILPTSALSDPSSENLWPTASTPERLRLSQTFLLLLQWNKMLLFF